MTSLFAALGITAGATLTALLIINLRHRQLALWPTQPSPSWQGATFWSLFRGLNISALALAAIDWQPMNEGDIVRLVAAAAALLGGLTYVSACILLGRVNLYGGKAGLVADGVYAWSRNPQYALAMPSYILLAVAAQSPLVAILVGLLVAVFVLMALGEEPWLEAAYGDDYAAYRAQVSRFYNIRRLVRLLLPDGASRGAAP
jgi:protein-S-isoprenylcysteine O-methyltransferase Ste14